MAITLTATKIGGQAHRLAYLVEAVVSAGTTGQQTATISNATLLTDCVTGALEDFFTNTTGASAAALQTAFYGRHSLRLSQIAGANTVANSISAAFAPDGSNKYTIALAFGLASAQDGTYQFFLELVFNEVGYGFPSPSS